MTAQLEADIDLIRDVIQSYTDHHDDLMVYARDFTDAVYWKVQGHSDDQPKLIGKGGTHVNALKHLISKLGTARNVVYNFELLPADPSKRREEYPPKVVTQHDPEPMRASLEILLKELGIGQYAIEIMTKPFERGGLIQYRFDIVPRSMEDYSSLFAANASGATLIGSLGTLFRARARKEGVVLNLEVQRP